MVMPLFYEVPLSSQGLLIIFHFKVYSQRAKMLFAKSFGCFAPSDSNIGRF